MEKALIRGKSGDQDSDARSRSLAPSQLQDPERPGEDTPPSYTGDLIISRPQSVDPSFSWDIPEKGLIEPLVDRFPPLNKAQDAEEDPASYICGKLYFYADGFLH